MRAHGTGEPLPPSRGKVGMGVSNSIRATLHFNDVGPLVRVVRSGGTLLTSVMSLFGATVDLVRRPYIQLLKDPDEEEVWRVIEDGDLLGFPSSEVEMQHPPMHLFSSDELRTLLPGCEVEELVGSNVTTFEGSTTIDQVAADQDAWSTSVKLERRLNSVPGLVDSGSHIIMAARKQKR